MAVLLDDNFTGSGLLSDHVADTGQAWTVYDYFGFAELTGDGRVVAPLGSQGTDAEVQQDVSGDDPISITLEIDHGGAFLTDYSGYWNITLYHDADDRFLSVSLTRQFWGQWDFGAYSSNSTSGGDGSNGNRILVGFPMTAGAHVVRFDCTSDGVRLYLDDVLADHCTTELLPGGALEFVDLDTYADSPSGAQIPSLSRLVIDGVGPTPPAPSTFWTGFVGTTETL